MNILSNAVDSIELGIEDFRAKDSKRLISATRNMFAGVLLLFKHKLAVLSQGSDEALLKASVLPQIIGGTVEWKGQGKKTVDFAQIKARFGSLGVVVDWKRLEKVQEYRNNLEHYYDTQRLHPDAVRQYILTCFDVACDFMRSELAVDPQNLFDAGTWRSWMEEKSIYDAEEKACSDLMDRVEWPNATAEKHIREACCPTCSSRLIKPVLPIEGDSENQRFQCAICSEEWDYRQVLLVACGQAKSAGDYLVYHDGAEPEIVECPECLHETYDTTEEECAACGAKGPYACGRCGISIEPHELAVAGGEYCGWCAHQMSKDD